MSRQALGTARLDNRLNFITTLGLYEGQLVKITKKRWEVDLPIDAVQIARISDVERWYSRFLRQFVTYWSIHSTRVDPSWTAVTGYYCAFYGTQTLMTMLGLGARSLPALGQLPAGLYRLTERPSIYTNHAVIGLHQQGTGSHKALWSQFVDVIDRLRGLPGNDAAATFALASLRQLATGPPSLAAVRNEINYSIDFAIDELGAWRSELELCTSVGELERRVASHTPTNRAHRFELIALATASFARALYEDYIERGKSLDLRPGSRRRTLLAAHGDDHPANRWF